MSTPLLAPFAARVRWHSPAQLDQSALRALLALLLEEIARRADMAGARLIGHIKAFATFHDGGYLRGSVTSPDQAADIDGVVPGHHQHFDATLNVLVYGLTAAEIDRVTRSALQSLAATRGATCTIELPASHPEPLHS